LTEKIKDLELQIKELLRKNKTHQKVLKFFLEEMNNEQLLPEKIICLLKNFSHGLRA